MITYKLSRREKALLVVFIIVLIALAWFAFVYRGTTDQYNKLESEIKATESAIEVDTVRVAQMNTMKQVIEQRKAEGAVKAQIPEYDNLKPLMDELNRIMGAAATYSLAFDQLDSTTSTEYVYRGVRIDFSCDSYAAAESIVNALANGAYPCVIDSVSIVDGSVRYGSDARVSASTHVTFIEKQPSTATTAKSSGGASAAAAGSTRTVS